MRFPLLQLCVILEPMQELMSRHKCYALSPRDCLKTTLFQKWQRIVAPPGKRGRRTVALHEKHQPVRKSSFCRRSWDRQCEIGFLPARLGTPFGSMLLAVVAFFLAITLRLPPVCSRQNGGTKRALLWHQDTYCASYAERVSSVKIFWMSKI